MGRSYGSDDSDGYDSEGSVVSVVHHGEEMSVAERRATQIRHVLRDGPPDSEEDTPPAIRLRRGDRGPFIRERRGEFSGAAHNAVRPSRRHSQRSGRNANHNRHVVWRDEREIEEGDERFQNDGRSFFDESDATYEQNAHREQTRDIQTYEPSHSNHNYSYSSRGDVLPSPGRVARFAKKFEDNTQGYQANSLSTHLEDAYDVGFRGFDSITPLKSGSGVAAARSALNDVARDLCEAHTRSAEKIAQLALTLDTREGRLQESARALRDVQRRLTGVLAAVDGTGEVTLEQLEREDLDARAVALRAAATEKASLLKQNHEKERTELVEAEAEARVARAEAAKAKAEMEAVACVAHAKAEAARARAEAEQLKRETLEAAKQRDARRKADLAKHGRIPRETNLDHERVSHQPRTAHPTHQVSSSDRPESICGFSVLDEDTRRDKALASKPPVQPRETTAGGLSRTRGFPAAEIGAVKKAPSTQLGTPSRNAVLHSNAEVTPTLTRARSISKTPVQTDTLAEQKLPQTQTPAPRENLESRLPLKTPTSKTIREVEVISSETTTGGDITTTAIATPAGPVSLSRTRKFHATALSVRATGPLNFGKSKTPQNLPVDGMPIKGLARTRSSTSSPTVKIERSNSPGKTPTLRDGIGLVSNLAPTESSPDVMSSTHASPGEPQNQTSKWRGLSNAPGLSRTRAFDGSGARLSKTRPAYGFGSAVNSAAASSGIVFTKPVDPEQAAIAQSRLARNRRYERSNKQG